MSDNANMDKVIDFRKSLYNIFDSIDGKIVLDFLQECYVDSPAISDKTELTFYRLGQKEFVQGLIKDATSKLELPKNDNLMEG